MKTVEGIKREEQQKMPGTGSENKKRGRKGRKGANGKGKKGRNGKTCLGLVLSISH